MNNMDYYFQVFPSHPYTIQSYSDGNKEKHRLWKVLIQHTRYFVYLDSGLCYQNF